MAKKKQPITQLDVTAAEYAAFVARASVDMSAADDITRQLREAASRQGDALRARAGGSVPPPANRGGKSEDGQIRLVLEGGVIKEVIKRRGFGGDAAFVDWLNFTVGIETFDDMDCTISDDTIQHPKERMIPVTPDDYALVISKTLKSILGYGISHFLGYGQHFYERTYALPEGWGTVSLGGQRETVLVSLSGTGLAAAREGWEHRLKTFLESAERPRITRADLSYDDYAGQLYSVNQADLDHTNGLFNCGGRNPRCEYRGDWKNPDGKGRSFYVGNRKNGKYCRVYEKGKELGDENSDWLRVEVEFKSCDRVIPFDVLIVPGEYLAASYPAFGWINKRQERIETTQRVAAAGVDRAVKWVRHQTGNTIRALVELFGVDEFLRRVQRDDKEPAFMRVPHFALASPAIHEVVYPNPSISTYAASVAF